MGSHITRFCQEKHFL